jgi:hypothetical protein
LLKKARPLGEKKNDFEVMMTMCWEQEISGFVEYCGYTPHTPDVVKD